MTGARIMTTLIHGLQDADKTVRRRVDVRRRRPGHGHDHRAPAADHRPPDHDRACPVRLDRSSTSRGSAAALPRSPVRPRFGPRSMHRTTWMHCIATAAYNACHDASCLDRRSLSAPWTDEPAWPFDTDGASNIGGEVAFVDLGEAALVLPGGAAPARAELRRRCLLSGGYERGLTMIDDPDLADQ